MQIHGAQLATAFSLRSSVLQDDARKPVTIDVKASLELNDEANNSSLASATKIVSPSQASIMVNDQQQARFVRFFSVNDFSPSSSSQDSPLQTIFASLPKGVQQYLNVEATSLESQQSLLDEIV